MRYKQSEIDELVSHLQTEFGSHGRRAAEYLLTARNLLDWAGEQEPALLRIGNAVAYCLREAMTGILNSQVDSGKSWRELSRRVVDAKQRHEQSHQSGFEEQRARIDLYESIDDLAAFHEGESVRERHLISVLLDRTGSTPVVSSASVPSYQRTLKSLNRIVHRSTRCGVDQAERIWSESVSLLRILFMPDERYSELDRLASVDQPSSEQVEHVSELVISGAHLRYFLARVESPYWLDMLTDAGLLDPPNNGDGWPVFVATERLAREHPAAVAHWLNKMYSRLSDNTKCLSMIGDAALKIGDIGLPLVARIALRHSAEPDVVRLAWDAAHGADSASDDFDTFVDIVFNQSSSSLGWTFGEIGERFANGIDSRNAISRLQLIASKIQSTPLSDHARSWHEYKPYGSISCRYDEQYDERFDALIHALMTGICNARRFVDLSSLLELVDDLPGMIGVRMRLWVLGSFPEVGVDAIVEEITGGIRQRRPNGDDLPLIDRAVQAADGAQYGDSWREAIGPAPGVEDVGRALAANEPREEWIRAFCWLSLLPGVATEPWDDVVAVLAARYGSMSRDVLETESEPPVGEIFGDDSPFSMNELASLSPNEACRRIASWRAQPGERRVTAHGLAETLERVVVGDPTQWVRHPLRIAMALRHPTYIHRYLMAVRTTLPNGNVPVDELIRLITLLRTHPWNANELGPVEFDYDSHWGHVDRTTIDLIESLAKNDLGFAGLSDKAWIILQSAVKVRSESTETIPAQRDPLSAAIGLPQTRALLAALEFMAYEFRSAKQVRSGALSLLSEALQIVGNDGLYHRAIIVRYLSLLRHIAPEWLERNRDLLLGSEAPNGLGLKTLDQALKRGKLNRWLLEEFRYGVMDAVHRRVEKAIAHYLWAVLWDWQGYSLGEAAEFLGSQPDLLEAAGDRLGYLLDSDGVKPFHIERAVQFWRRMLDKRKLVDGIVGFGGLARVTEMDDRQWSELTLETLRRTCGRINQAHEVAQRAAGMTPGVTTLEIVDNLVRRSNRVDSNDVQDRIFYHTKWAQRQVESAARELLNRSASLRDTDHYKRLYTTLRERGIEVSHPREALKSRPSEPPRSAAINGTSSARPKNRTSTPS